MKVKASISMETSIFITGIGIVTPFGIGLEAFREGMASQKSCIDNIVAYDLSRCRASRGAYYSDFRPEAYDSSAGFGRVARGTQFSIIATEDALRDAQVSSENQEPHRLGLVYSSARVALEKSEKFYATLLKKGPRFVNPLTFQETVNNAPASHICLRNKITGPSLTITSGGVSGIQAIEVAMQWLRLNKVDVAIVTATEVLEATSQEVHSFAHGHAPVDANGINDSCPFDLRRNGYLLGEAAVSFVIETASHASSRGASAKAELAGCGVSHEAFARGRIHPDGLGIEDAIQLTLKAAGKTPDEVPWIISGAQSSRIADLAEARALKRVFGSRSSSPFVSAIKSIFGETEAASAGIGIAAAIVGMQDSILHPTLNCQELDPACEVNLVTSRRREPVSAALINSIWFGGGNAAVYVEKPRV